MIIEEILQDQESFKNYTISDQYLSIKRGDFLIRNYGNIEIDIKCRNFYKNNNEDLVFNFKKEDVEKHINMQSLIKTPIMIAVYQRDGDEVVEDVPFIFTVKDIHDKSLPEIHIQANNTGLCYQIPLKLTIQDFSYIKQYCANNKV